ncbi:MAG: hypothetical protein WCE23_16575 [Candidatus Binatus sp.]|uniref:hypothetical protein n=1 Tax=Candidatus Binatus sp. TaxID=2811406 RepID=UPI003C7502F1
MPDITYGVIFKAVDQLSDKLSSFGGGFMNLGNQVEAFSGKLFEAGEGLTRFGERLSLDAALMRDGADHLRELSDAISEPAFAMQKSLATTAAMTGLADSELAKLKETAIDFSNHHPGTTAEQYVSGFTRMREIFQDTNKAMKAEDTAAMLTRFGFEGEAATNLFGAAYANLGVDAATTGDQLIRTVQSFGVLPERAQQFAMAIGRLGGTASQTNTPLAELLSLTGAASQQLGGSGRGAMQFASMIREMVKASDEGKSSIIWSRGLADGLQQLRGSIAGLPTSEKMGALGKIGVSDSGMMLKYLDNLDQTMAKERGVASGAATVGSAFETATANASDRIVGLHQNIDSLFDALATPALPMYSSAIGWLTKEVQGATSASGKFSSVTGPVVFGMSAAGYVGYYAATALSTLGMATMGVGNSMKALSYVPTLFRGISSAATYFNPIAIAENAIMIATKAWAAAQWLVNIAMDANPIGIAIAGAVALAAAAYEIYEHWSAVRGMLTSFGEWAGGWALKLGKAILIGIAGPFGMIAYEIYSHWDSIKAACEKLAGGIASYFVHHSPPEVGPLRNLAHIQIAETIAERIRPAPVLAAIRRTAAAAAIASATIVAGASGPALAGGGVGGAGGGIVINSPITINVGPGTDIASFEKVVVKAIENQRYQVEKILEGERERKERTVLS